MAESHSRNRIARNLVIGCLVLLILYALAGFLLLPWWLQRMLPEQLDQRMGWQAAVENIRINPFTLSVETTGLDAKDSNGEQVVGFDRLFVNLGFFQLVRGTIGFQEIELQEPFIRLDLLKDYSVNFAKDWQSHNPPADEPEPQSVEADADETPPRLYFGKIAIQGGELLFRDFSQQEPAEFRIQPLDLTLNDLATWARDDEDSRYHLLAAIGSQTIDWQGELSITPLYSKGTLKISDVGYETLKHFLAPVLPYDLRGGQVSLQSDYELQAGENLYLTASQGTLSLKDLAVAIDAQSDEARLTTGTINIATIGFNLSAREAQVGQVTVDTLGLALARDTAGIIDWLVPLNKAGEEPSPPAEDDASASQPFYWSVAGIALSNSQVQWQDSQPDTSVDLRLEHVSVSIGKLSDQLEEPVTYKADMTLASGGTLSLQGQVTPAPFNLEMALSGTDIALAAFTPYLQEGANLTIAGGKLGVDGHLDLDGQKDPLTGTFNGTAEIKGLAMNLPGEKSPLVSWQTLRLSPIEYNVYPARLEIGTITLKHPAVNVVLGKDNISNLEQVVQSSGGDQATEAEPSAADNNTGEPGFIFRIGHVLLDNGSVAYTDRTISPVFSTSLEKLSGSISGLSNISPQQGKVAISGVVDQVATVNFQGELGTLGSDDVSDLKLTMKDLSMPSLTPYFGRYIGYGVDSGKLNLKLDYKIAGTRIDASNVVIMDRLELGKAVASDQAVNAPVKLGLALLRDQNGVIEVDLPISGDLSDPAFGVGQMVMRTFVNLLVKAAASPFSMLGSIAEMAGLSGEELGQVSFEPGSAELADSEAEKLKALAGALRERPNLMLNIRGGFSPETDGLALLRNELTNNGKEPLSEDAWLSAREAYIAGERALPPEALNRLASARANVVRVALQDTYDVPPGQLFLRELSGNAEVDGDGEVVNKFTLNVR
ncbi:MAG TPA: DUF748 domain-containing protein [Marinobacter sp.]|nr:DUF748 domain-containing protein [Marinobacter sp.]